MKKLNLHETVSILDLHRDYQTEQDKPSMAGYHLVEFEGKQYYSATDAHRLILIPKTDIVLDCNTHEKAVKIASVLVPTKRHNLSTPIDTTKIVELYKPIPEVDEMVECESCDGNGTFEHYGFTYDCEMCDGKGEHKSKNKIKDPDYLIKIENTTINNRLAYDLYKICSIIEDVIVTVVFSNKYQIFLKIGDMFTLIASKISNEKSTIIEYSFQPENAN